MRYPDPVFAGQLREGLKDFLNLSGEYINTLYLHHVICSSLNDVYSGIGAAAGTFSGDNSGEVMRTISDKRSTLLNESSYNNFTPLPVRNILTCLRINYLKVEIIIPIVNTSIVLTVDSDSRTVYLRKSVDIVKLNTKLT